VAQGEGGTTYGEKPLRSDGFAMCSALILRNTRTLESALFHIYSDLHLDYNQTSIAAQLVKDYIVGLDIDGKEKKALFPLISSAARYWNLKNSTDTDYDDEQRNAFKTRMTELNRDRGIKACFVRGDISRDLKNRIYEEFLSYLGINSIQEILVKTSGFHWSMAYKPRESTVLVNLTKQKKVLSYSF
jgi:hypothetical protein